MTPKPYTNPTSCRFCGREAQGACQRPSCRVRREYAERPTSLLPPLALDMNVSELPDVVTRDHNHEAPERCDICRRRGPAVEDRDRPGVLCHRCAGMSQATTAVPLHPRGTKPMSGVR